MVETGIYVRVSTEEQAKEGYSIRAQEQKLKDYSRIKEWHVYKVYMDDGISGKDIKGRLAIQELIDDVEKGNINNVLVFKIDRLTRNTADLIYLINLFNSYNCAFNSLSESIDTQTASGRMFIKIVGIFAEFERENIIERAKIGFERKVREGYTLASRTVSYGYDRKPGEKIQTINKYEASIVKEVFDMFVNKHMSCLDIAKNLNERKIHTKENSEWYTRAIKNMLTNCNYVGMVRYAMKDKKRNFETKGMHEAIISKELYEEAQNLIKKISVKCYTKRPKEDAYFVGVLYCAECGGRMSSHGNYYKNKNGETIVKKDYRCCNYIKKACNASNISHQKVEEAFRTYINNIEDFNVLNEIQISEEQEKQESGKSPRSCADSPARRSIGMGVVFRFIDGIRLESLCKKKCGRSNAHHCVHQLLQDLRYCRRDHIAGSLEISPQHSQIGHDPYGRRKRKQGVLAEWHTQKLRQRIRSKTQDRSSDPARRSGVQKSCL